MPTYDYSCTQCAHSFELVQSFTDDALSTCPQCQGRLRKVFGNVGVVFKGSGFYRNDARDAAKKSSSSNTPSPATKAEGGADAATSTGSGATEAATSAKPASTEGSTSTAGTSAPAGQGKSAAGSGSGSAA